MADIDTKLRNIRVKLFEHATLATLETDINDWLDAISDPSVAGSERELVAIHLSSNLVGSTCMIVYTE